MFAVLSACAISTPAWSDTTYKYGQSQCSFSDDQFDGRSMRFYGEIDTDTNSGTIGWEYEIKFKKPNHYYNPCGDMLDLIETRTLLDIEEQRLEIQRLQVQLQEMYKRLEARDSAATTTTQEIEGDW